MFEHIYPVTCAVLVMFYACRVQLLVCQLQATDCQDGSIHPLAVLSRNVVCRGSLVGLALVRCSWRLQEHCDVWRIVGGGLVAFVGIVEECKGCFALCSRLACPRFRSCGM
jgi:hypothetical protein